MAKPAPYYVVYRNEHPYSDDCDLELLYSLRDFRSLPAARRFAATHMPATVMRRSHIEQTCPGVDHWLWEDEEV